MYNLFCFSTATMFARTRLYVTLYDIAWFVIILHHTTMQEVTPLILYYSPREKLSTDDKTLLDFRPKSLKKKRERERKHPNKVETILEMSAERNICTVISNKS